MCVQACACMCTYVCMCARGWRSGSGCLAVSSLKTFWVAGLRVSFSVRCHSRPFRAAPSGGPRKALVFRRRPSLLLQAAPARPAQTLHRPPIHHCSVMPNPFPSSSAPLVPPAHPPVGVVSWGAARTPSLVLPASPPEPLPRY